MIGVLASYHAAITEGSLRERVLVLLKRAGRPLSRTEMLHELGVDGTRLGVSLLRMTRAGLVRREQRTAGSGRLYHVYWVRS